MTTADKIEANADLIKWCVQVLGPDDIYAAPSHAEAVAYAAELNQVMHKPDKLPADVLCFACVAPWPYSDDEHAEAVKDWRQ